MKQTWKDLFFIHWPISEDILRPFVPEELELDLYDGTAWIAIVPFRMKQIRLKGIPTFPIGHSLLELNLRTYVKHKEEQGVYFFSLDANNPLAVFLARTCFGLNYLTASMTYKQHLDHVHYTSRRTHPSTPSSHFHATFTVLSSPFHAQPGSLMYWLTERYALWVKRREHVYKGPIFHHHWPLQKAEATIYTNTLPDFLQDHTTFLTEPVTYYSPFLETTIFPFEKQL
jgi:uncharacterized protein YqjF (DUF2071 family)